MDPVLFLSANTVDLLKAVGQNDALGWAIILFLSGLSVYSFTVIFHKFFVIRTARAQTDAFRDVVESEDSSWDKLYSATKNFPESPVANLLRETYVECRIESWFDTQQKDGGDLELKLTMAKHTIEGVLLRTMSAEESRLVRKLPVLSTITTLAPFVGLFGTVWGVLAAFQSLGREGSASITALAPGISTALMTTIFGLFAAIPALIAYNYFMTQIHHLSTEMESFSHDLENAVRKQILNGNRGPR